MKNARDIQHQPLQFVPVNSSRSFGVWCCENAFSYEECDQIDEIVSGVEFEHARVGPTIADEITHDVRNSNVAWIGNNPATSWLYMKLMQNAQWANLHLGGIEIWGFAEALQYSIYPEGGRYCWHMDSGIHPEEVPRQPRKLSFTLQLSDPDEYEGGEFELLASEKYIASKRRGDMIVFPSYMTHRVNTVTSGVRKSLVGWICGPQFK